MTETIRHEPEESRYLLVDDSGHELGLADYRLRDDRILFTHTEVDPSQRGRGLGGKLIKGALDDTRTRFTQRVVPLCPFVDEWIEAHPDYRDLVTR
ncbi:N-acetyltransferase [Naasia lichenicola]|uniref:N-acetyltransferase n=1 Tax=Naasia lichenicola TaxID=2565933 RepID=A0A4S4FHT7_9MICO|nr:GNAT family N-acetyltransferase [Naasia lichenicola]THG29382.1 N-acetyltransferase [Naasia lichenicola]